MEIWQHCLKDILSKLKVATLDKKNILQHLYCLHQERVTVPQIIITNHQTYYI